MANDQDALSGLIIGSIFGIVLIVSLIIVIILAVIILIFKYGFEKSDLSGLSPFDNIKGTLKYLGSTSSSRLPWHIITPVILLAVMIYYFSIAVWYKYTRGQWRSAPSSVATLTTIRNSILSSTLGTLNKSVTSVTTSLTGKPIRSPFNRILTDTSSIGDQRAVLNWRPLTVRLAGYLGGGGSNVKLDGVFDMANGVQYALSQGARGFIFDIDYLEKAPCRPVIAFRDASGVLRSLNTGCITDGLKALADKAFATNYDPVVIILYLRRVPPGKKQQAKFFGNIASSIQTGIQDTSLLLGQSSQGNFHNCRSESSLFTSPIIDYQKKFILLTNYNTNLLPYTSNPTDNLDFWMNGRIYKDQSGSSASLGEITQTVPSGQVSYIEVGDFTQLLNIGKNDQPTYQTSSQSIFKIALAPPDIAPTTSQVSFLLNTLGVQCVPLDVVNLAAAPEHQATVAVNVAPSTRINTLTSMTQLSSNTNDNDPLSFWTYTGWSWKNLEEYKKSNTESFADYNEGFESSAKKILPPGPIAGFIIPKPIPPKMPPASLNSNGGMITIK